MFSKTAHYYDAIYSWKDYVAETSAIIEIITGQGHSDGNRVLDVACGTGMHMQYLIEDFEVEGLDLDENLLALARQRVPGAAFHHGDMVDFDLGKRFDAVICLFSSIGYVKTKKRLHRAISCMANHLHSGGLLIVEPWFTPDNFYPGTVHAKFIDEPELKIARVNTSFVEGSISLFDMHYLIGTPDGTDHYVERHELGLFTVDEMRTAFESTGLEVTYQEDGLMGRGLYIGQR
jgi:SAM-dependent methyltransferase